MASNCLHGKRFNDIEFYKIISKLLYVCPDVAFYFMLNIFSRLIYVFVGKAFFSHSARVRSTIGPIHVYTADSDKSCSFKSADENFSAQE